MKGRTIRRLAIKTMIFAKKALPYVLTALSAAGTVAVTVEAVKAIKKNTPEVYYAKQDDSIDVLDEKGDQGAIVCISNSNAEALRKKIVNGVKTYWKPIVYCTGSLACLAGSTFIFTKRQQQMLIGLSQMENLLRRYTNAAVATAGAGGAAALNKLEPSNYPENIPFDIEDDGKVLFWDPVFDYWFRASMENFLDGAYKTSSEFSKQGSVSVLYFYKQMEVPSPIDEDENGYLGWGWWIDDDLEWCDFYGEDCGYLAISCTEVKTINDDIEYREICYYHAPMFNMNGRMLDGKGRNFYDLKWLYD